MRLYLGTTYVLYLRLCRRYETEPIQCFHDNPLFSMDITKIAMVS